MGPTMHVVRRPLPEWPRLAARRTLIAMALAGATLSAAPRVQAAVVALDPYPVSAPVLWPRRRSTRRTLCSFDEIRYRLDRRGACPRLRASRADGKR
jgi:hypothetical protein